MKNLETWYKIGARITVAQPQDLDTIFEDGDQAVPERALPKQGGSLRKTDLDNWIAPSAALWSTNEVDQVFIGVRVTEPVKAPAEIAARLVAIACERNVMPVILSSLRQSGFEQFGFRIERIVGDTELERAQYEEELKRFWDIGLTLNASDILLQH